MENLKAKFVIFDKKLKRFVISYVMAVAVLLMVVAISVVIREYSESFNETLRELQRFQMNLVKIKGATTDIKDSIQTVNTIIAPDYFTITSEKQLLAGLDLLKTNARGSVVTITEIVYGDSEMSLPLTIKGYLKDYSDFVNDIGKLQSYKFPFYTIKSISIKKDDSSTAGQSETKGQGNKGVFVYEIIGDLRLPRSSQMVLGRAADGGGSEQPEVVPEVPAALGAKNTEKPVPVRRVR